MRIFAMVFDGILLTLVLLFMLVLLGIMKILRVIDDHLFCTCRATEAVYSLMEKLASIFGAED